MAKRPPNLKRGAHTQAPARKWQSTTRLGRKARGYGCEWDKLRARILKGEPLCRSCRATGRAVVAVTVDHIKAKHLGGTDDDSNLQPLCDPCHKAKTAREGRSRRG